MGTLYLVRHGQASFGSDDYDRLSELGQRQSARLGQYWAERDVRFDAVLTGTLRRHAQTWEAMASAAGWTQTPLIWPGLDEYDSEAVIRAVLPCRHDAQLGDPGSAEGYRAHFRLLRDGLAQWMADTVSPQGMPTYLAFVHGVTSALDHVRHHHTDHKVLMVTSGGPIAAAIGHVLGLSPDATIELNMRTRNSALTEFVFSRRRHNLLSYNTLPHLDGAEYASWTTYA